MGGSCFITPVLLRGQSQLLNYLAFTFYFEEKLISWEKSHSSYKKQAKPHRLSGHRRALSSWTWVVSHQVLIGAGDNHHPEEQAKWGTGGRAKNDTDHPLTDYKCTRTHFHYEWCSGALAPTSLQDTLLTLRKTCPCTIGIQQVPSFC